VRQGQFFDEYTDSPIPSPFSQNPVGGAAFVIFSTNTTEASTMTNPQKDATQRG